MLPVRDISVRCKESISIPDGKTILTASSDKTIRTWNIGGKQTREIKSGITHGLYCVRYSPDGNAILAAGLSKTWQVWKGGEDSPAQTIQGHTDSIYRAIYNFKGNRIATIGYSGQLFIWDANSAKKLHEQKIPVVAAYSIAYSPDGKELAIGTQDKRVMVLSIPGNAQ